MLRSRSCNQSPMSILAALLVIAGGALPTALAQVPWILTEAHQVPASLLDALVLDATAPTLAGHAGELPGLDPQAHAEQSMLVRLSLARGNPAELLELTCAVRTTPDGELLRSAWRGHSATRILIVLPEGTRDRPALISELQLQGIQIRRDSPLAARILVDVPPPGELRLGLAAAALERVRRILGERGEAFIDAVDFPQDYIPYDANWQNLYGLRLIDGPKAWDLARGDPDIVVGVSDTGVRLNHPDLMNILWVNPGEIPGNGIDDDGNGFVDDVHGYDFATDQPLIVQNDTHGHGTHVGGTMAAEGDNQIGVAGVAFGSRLMVLRSGVSVFYQSDQIEAIDYATLMRRVYGVRVVSTNHSYGSLSNSMSVSVRTAIGKHRNADILYVAAAGNDSNNNDGTTNHMPSGMVLLDHPEPGDWENVLAVAACNSSGGKPGFSNWGLTTVDLAAPGDGINSTTNNNSYGNKNGTSMASPHVAGAVGSVASANPSLGGQQIRSILMDTVNKTISNGYWNTRVASGGVLNLHNAITQALTYPVIRLQTPADGQFIYPGHSVDLIATATDGDGTVTQVAFFANGQQIGLDTNGSDGWSLRYTPPAAGMYELHAQATDNDGKVTRTRDLRRLHVGHVVVDDRDVASITTSGSWLRRSTTPNNSSAAPNAFRDSYLETFDTTGVNTVTFTPVLPVNGSWKVEIFIPNIAGQSTNLPVSVLHDAGTANTTINASATANRGKWLNVGTFNLTSGSASVTIRENGTSSADLADAIRFLYQGSAPANAAAVSVFALQTTFLETDGTARVSFSRTSTTGTLTVPYTVGGTAVAGVNFAPLSGTVSFDNGQSVAHLDITPLNDGVFTPDLTLSITALDGPAHRVGLPASVQLRIANVTNSPPVASAGPDIVVDDTDGNGSENVTLNASASSDPDGNITQYRWWAGTTHLGTGSPVTVSRNVGTSLITLEVTDSAGLSSTSSLNVRVNGRPTANVGHPRAAVLGEPLVVAATATDDGWPAPLTVGWTQINGPGTASFSPSNAAATTISFDQVGTYLLRLSASDTRLTHTADLTVRVYPAGSVLVELLSTDDAHIRSGSNANTVYNGNEIELRQNGDTHADTRWGLVKFDASAVNHTGSLIDAWFLPTTTTHNSTPTHSAFTIADDAWQESTVTWNTAPAFGSVISTWKTTASGRQEWINVLPYAQTEWTTDPARLISIGLKISSNHDARYASRQNSTAANRPRLLLVFQNLGPSVLITSPAPAASHVVNLPISITGQATSTLGDITSVELFANAVSLGQATLHPAGTFSHSFTPTSTGNYVITATATDQTSATNTSAPVAIQVVDADTTPPVLQSTTVLTSTTIDLLFNEALLPSSITSPAQYVVSPGNISPATATLQPDTRTIRLGFAAPFADGSYTISISGVADLMGNQVPTGTQGAFIITSLPPGTFLESGGLLVMEAEHFTEKFAGTASSTLNHHWNLVTTPAGFSGSGLMEAQPNTSVNVQAETTGPRMDYRAYFALPGTYQVWVRMWGPNGNDDSFHVGLDGVIRTATAGMTNSSNQWVWLNVANSARVTVQIPDPGIYTINLWMREDGTRVDKLLLTTDAAYTPTGIGPEESQRQPDSPQPPQVAITTPGSPHASTVGQPVQITGTASVSSASITAVEIFLDTNTKLGDAALLNGTWSFTWSNPPPGNYSYFARATADNALQTSTPLRALRVCELEDLNRDGLIDEADALAAAAQLGLTLPSQPADLNLDGRVDAEDFSLLLRRIGQALP